MKIFRKTLKEAGKGSSRDTWVSVHIRSQQQWVRNSVEYFTLHLFPHIILLFSYVFKRWAKQVKQKVTEMNLCQHVTPIMVSEEEEEGDSFVRYRHRYQSNKICPYTGAECQLTAHILHHIDHVMLSVIQQVCGKAWLALWEEKRKEVPGQETHLWQQTSESSSRKHPRVDESCCGPEHSNGQSTLWTGIYWQQW